MPLQTYTATDGKTYTVDYRLKQFRYVPDNYGIIEFIDFKDWKGDEILCEMLERDLVPEDKMGMLV